MENLSFCSSMVQILRSNVYTRHFVNNLVYSQLSTYASFVIIYFAYNSANTQYITTLTTGVMFTKHLPHSCVSLNVIRKMQMNLDGIFNNSTTSLHLLSGLNGGCAFQTAEYINFTNNGQ